MRNAICNVHFCLAGATEKKQQHNGNIKSVVSMRKKPNQEAMEIKYANQMRETDINTHTQRKSIETINDVLMHNAK